jgi:hypothetical protein
MSSRNGTIEFAGKIMSVRDRATVCALTKEALEQIKEGGITPDIAEIPSVGAITESEVSTLQNYLK